MARRRNSSKGGEAVIGCLALAGLAAIVLIKLIIAILPYLLVGAAIYGIYRWADSRFKIHEGDWQLFYAQDVKPILKVAMYVVPILSVIAGWLIYQDHKRREQIEITLEAERLEQAKKDSIANIQRLANIEKANNFYFQADSALLKNKPDVALALLDSSLMLVPHEKDVLATKARIYLKKKQCINARETASKMSEYDPVRDSILLAVGKCFTGKNNRDAALVYASLAKNGNKEAAKLYEKVNPMIRKYSHSMTRCCDGTTSGSSGRGACSHHGGVCGSKTYYNESRKYPEIK